MRAHFGFVTCASFSLLALAACGQGSEGASAPSGSASPAATSAVAPAVTIPTGYVHVPGGKMAHVDCIHEIPEGANLERNGDVTLDGKVVNHFEKCQHETLRGEAISRKNEGVKAAENVNGEGPSYGGWVEASWAYASNIGGIAEYNHMNSGNWIVPTAPSSNDNQLIYMFPSFQSSTVIVQPVLQWGATTAGGQGVIGGSYWIYAAWVETDGTFYHSAGIRVNEHDTLNGWMDLGDVLSPNYAWWSIGGTDVTTGQTMGGSFWVDGKNWFGSAQSGVLEAYGITKCSDFPASGSTIFGNPSITEAGPTWSKENPTSPSWSGVLYWQAPSYNGPSCGFAITATASNGTTLSY